MDLKMSDEPNQYYVYVIDLDKIWKDHVIDEELAAVINFVTYRIRNVIINVDSRTDGKKCFSDGLPSKNITFTTCM